MKCQHNLETFIVQVRDHDERQPLNYTVAPFFDHLKEVYPLYRALLWAGKASYVFDQLQKYLSELFESRLRAAHPGETLDPLADLAAHAAVGALIALIVWWFDHKMVYPPERMDDIYKKLVMNGFNGCYVETDPKLSDH